MQLPLATGQLQGVPAALYVEVLYEGEVVCAPPRHPCSPGAPCSMECGAPPERRRELRLAQADGTRVTSRSLDSVLQLSEGQMVTGAAFFAGDEIDIVLQEPGDEIEWTRLSAAAGATAAQRPEILNGSRQRRFRQRILRPTQTFRPSFATRSQPVSPCRTAIVRRPYRASRAVLGIQRRAATRALRSLSSAPAGAEEKWSMSPGLESAHPLLGGAFATRSSFEDRSDYMPLSEKANRCFCR